MAKRLEIFANPDGSHYTALVDAETFGALEGSVGELAHELHADPYRLRCSIANGSVPSTFLGSGRYRIPGDVVGRVDSSGRLRPREDDEVRAPEPESLGESQPSSSLVSVAHSLPFVPDTFDASGTRALPFDRERFVT